MPCTFRLTTTRPDGRREDIPLDELLQESELLLNNVYTEISRQVEEVTVGTDPNTVTIERMTEVVFNNPQGQSLTLIFANPTEGTP
jgi:hypothetical protein